jgi:hypothetical protein
MSIKEIKEQLKENVDKLSIADTRLAAKELGMYFEYLKDRKEMPKKFKLNFEQYMQLLESIKESKKGKLNPASKVFTAIKRRYGFSN